MEGRIPEPPEAKLTPPSKLVPLASGSKYGIGGDSFMIWAATKVKTQLYLMQKIDYCRDEKRRNLKVE